MNITIVIIKEDDLCKYLATYFMISSITCLLYKVILHCFKYEMKYVHETTYNGSLFFNELHSNWLAAACLVCTFTDLWQAS